MRIEKNQKKSFELSVSSSKKQKSLFFYITQLVLNHRVTSRQKLSFKSIDFGTIVAFIPLSLALSQFLLQKSLFSNQSVFTKNLPLFNQFQPKISFETFEYISKSDVSLKAGPPQARFGQQKYIAIIPTSFSKIAEKGVENESNYFHGLLCDFDLLPSGNFLSKTTSITRLARNLDELPAYAQSFFLSTSKNTSGFNSLNLGKKENKLDQNKNLSTGSAKIKFSDEKKKNSINKLPGLKLTTQNNLIPALKKSEFKTKILLVYPCKKDSNLVQLKQSSDSNTYPELFSNATQFFKDRIEFQDMLKNLNSQVTTLFAQKNLSLYSDFLSLENTVASDQISSKLSSTELEKREHLNLFDKELRTNLDNIGYFSLKPEDDFFSETRLQELQKKQISTDFGLIRFLSGYNYPDMTAKQFGWLGGQTPWKKSNFTTITLEPSTLPTLSKKFPFNIKKFPTQISIKKTQTFYQDPESNQILYNASGLILDSQRALDWEMKNKNNVLDWFHLYLSPQNSLISSVSNFFGPFNRPQLKTQGDFQSTSVLLDEFPNYLFTFRSNSKMTGITPGITHSPFAFSPSCVSFQFFYENSEIKPCFVHNLEIRSSSPTEIHLKEDEPNFNKLGIVNVPVLRTQRPYFMDLHAEDFGKGEGRTQRFQTYSPYFNFVSKGNPDYAFSKNLVLQENWHKKKTSGHYLKKPSIFSKAQIFQKLKLDNWEPLTSKSWLIVTQLSFAFFVFQILKSSGETYGRELLGYLVELVSLLGNLDPSTKQELDFLLGNREKGFRVILQSQKSFKDIVGIQHLLPEISEVIWFLRNSARDFALSQSIPHGLLLTGPPGTGKTLLVQALAGEAQVPVIALSGSSLLEPGDFFPAVKLQKVFEEARALSPCIVFIDEIDTLAEKRGGVLENSISLDHLAILEASIRNRDVKSPRTRMQLEVEKLEKQNQDDLSTQHFKDRSEQEVLTLLTQFLTELDGIQGRKGIIVIGATNRPEVLDPAVLRPGRLSKIVQVGLPGHKKRVEILQFYGQGLGYQESIPWKYIADRTTGFTAADLATLMNESTIKAILNQSCHTVETIEHGIDRLTTSSSENSSIWKTKTSISRKNNESMINLENKFEEENLQQNHSLETSSKMEILRLAYYQAGKIVVSALLETHPNTLVACLWPRRPNMRSAQIATNLQNTLFEYVGRSEILERVIGCYAGKAAEILFIQQFCSQTNHHAHLSTLGLEDLLFGQKLVDSVLDKWAFYSKKSHICHDLSLPLNKNEIEFKENPETLEFYSKILKQIQDPPMSNALDKEISSLGSNTQLALTNSNAQIFYSIPWWQEQISSEFEFMRLKAVNWTRLYLSNPERKEYNVEWLPPDDFYHSLSSLKSLKKAVLNIKTALAIVNFKTAVLNWKTAMPYDEFLSLLMILVKLLQITKPIEVAGATEINQVSEVTEPSGVTEVIEQSELNEPTQKNEVIATTETSTSRKYESVFSWNNLELITRDYSGHSLILQSFNKALVILNQNRELMDRLVIELLSNEILREPEIEKILQEFESEPVSLKNKKSPNFVNSKQKRQILESAWGFESRKVKPKWIDFEFFS
jgi:ATP-dependent Zn protease